MRRLRRHAPPQPIFHRTVPVSRRSGHELFIADGVAKTGHSRQLHDLSHPFEWGYHNQRCLTVTTTSGVGAKKMANELFIGERMAT